MITSRQSLFFPVVIRVTFLVIALIFFIKGSPHYKLSPIVLHSISTFVLISIFTTRTQFDINVETKTFRYYIWFLGMKIGRTERYLEIDKIFINQVSASSNILFPYQTPFAMQSRDSLFKSFIKIDNDKLFLASDWKKDRLIKKLNAFNETLQTTIYDNTSR
jgi:hypothetical protein